MEKGRLVHRSIREIPLVDRPTRRRVGLDIFDLAGRLVATADNWDGIIELIATLSRGDYTIICSAGQRLAVATVGEHCGATLRIYRP
jgi:hypothetical protein